VRLVKRFCDETACDVYCITLNGKPGPGWRCGDHVQLSLTSQQLAEEGANRAADHAERDVNGWKEDAVMGFVTYLTTQVVMGGLLTTEKARTWAQAEAPRLITSEERAWGYVAVEVKKQGYIEHAGWTTAKNRKVHNTPVTLWRRIK
jgi:hypothetical protein